ncbi:MAG: hypothetical protein KDA71_18550 [Planctomycetales bacterium]|nr:hypothetical protein [Planctomycetales bacterium]
MNISNLDKATTDEMRKELAEFRERYVFDGHTKACYLKRAELGVAFACDCGADALFTQLRDMGATDGK